LKTLFCVLQILVIALFCLAVPAGAQSVRLNQPVPLDIVLPEIRADHTQATLDFSQQKGDRNLVLFFLSEQCGVTYFYKVRLQKLVRDFEGKGFVFVGVRCGKKLHPEAPVQLAEKNYLKISFVDDIHGEVVARFAVRQSLTFAVIDKAGLLRYQGGFDDSIDEGRVRKRPLRDALRDLAAGRVVAHPGGRSFGCAIVPMAP
jgi:hypothetical protein